jgi:hypothetical protein
VFLNEFLLNWLSAKCTHLGKYWHLFEVLLENGTSKSSPYMWCRQVSMQDKSESAVPTGFVFHRPAPTILWYKVELQLRRLFENGIWPPPGTAVMAEILGISI